MSRDFNGPATSSQNAFVKALFHDLEENSLKVNQFITFLLHHRIISYVEENNESYQVIIIKINHESLNLNIYRYVKIFTLSLFILLCIF